jgi:hypothetical protein
MLSRMLRVTDSGLILISRLVVTNPVLEWRYQADALIDSQ